MVKYSDENKSEFVHRILRSNGFGSVERVATPRKPIKDRDRSEIVKEQVEREAFYFSKAWQFGSAEKWKWVP